MSIKGHIKGLQHIGIPSGDVDATIAFYERIGFELTYTTPFGDGKVAFLTLGDIVIETYYAADPAMHTGAIDHLTIDVDDIEAVYKLCGEIGLPILDEGIIDLPFFNGVRFFMVEGANKEKVEFNQML
jgi:catechol 2,3-dioxygenase-like lactoylglutathione lyase family enzyme